MRPDVLRARVLALLSELDPYGLQPGSAGGAPADEYSPGAGAINEVLRKQGVVTSSELDEIWSQWFGEPLVSKSNTETVAELVVALNALVDTSPGSRDSK